MTLTLKRSPEPIRSIILRLAIASLAAFNGFAADFDISSINRQGEIAWHNAFATGVVSALTATNLAGPWQPQENYYTSNTAGGLRLSLDSGNRFCRLLSVDISANTPHHFTNLLHSYGILETIAGTNLPGGGADKSNYWRPWYEGGPATHACLSRPHSVFANLANNLLIVDEGSGSVLKGTPEGTIHTFAGTHTNSARTTDVPSPATNVNLTLPQRGLDAR